MPQKWSFTQIEGVGERKTLTLEGYNAPFGRPRQGAVVKETVKVRLQTKYIPGLNDAPQRTSFGAGWEPTELHGRWMTKNLRATALSANEVADQWVLFVRDQRTIRMAWGSIVSYVGFIEELELSREGEHEVAWKMKIQVDKRDDIGKVKKFQAATPISEDTTKLLGLITNVTVIPPKIRPNLDLDFLDELDNLAALANEPSALLNKLAGRFDDLERGTFSTLQHFRGAIQGCRTALLTFHEVIEDAHLDGILATGSPNPLALRTADGEVDWSAFETSEMIDFTDAMALLSQLDRKVELAGAAEVSKLITAVLGDTWESLATRAYNDPAKAGDIRTANGATYGAQPVPSEIYFVP